MTYLTYFNVKQRPSTQFIHAHNLALIPKPAALYIVSSLGAINHEPPRINSIWIGFVIIDCIPAGLGQIHEYPNCM